MNVLADFPIRVNYSLNGSLAWASDSNSLFVLSEDGDIRCLDASAKNALAKWRIHTDKRPRRLVLARNDAVIATSAESSVSLWDAKTHQQIGDVIYHSHSILTATISQPSSTIAAAGDKGIALRNLCDSDALASPYRGREIHRLKSEKNGLENTDRSLRALDSRQSALISCVTQPR